MEQTVQQERRIHVIPATKQATAPGRASGRKQRVAAYCRVSTDSEEQLTSYTAQKAYYTQKIDENPDWEMAGIFADKGITGTSMKKRVEFKKMIAACKRGKIDLILTKSLSRFARNTVDSLEVVRMLRANGIQGWTYQVVRNILTNERYIGDALLQKTYTTDCISKTVKKNQGDRPMVYVERNHPAIVSKAMFYQVREEMARRASKRKVMQKTGKTEQGKYSAKYALSELLVCGECGTPYKRCTWARNGKKRIVWRCVSRLEFGTKYCHNSPSMDEDKLHQAILEGINEFVQAGQGLGDELLDLASIVQQGGSADGIDPLTLRNRLDALTAQQAELLDKVLEDMENEELNAQLKATMEEKQAILGRLGALQQDEEQRAGQEARLRELAEWLKQQKSEFTEYDDTITRRYVERITVVDAETIRIKFRYTDVEIDRAVRT